MNSRLTVSALFILVAATILAPDAAVAFAKLKALRGCWEGKGAENRAVQVINRVSTGASLLLHEALAGPGDVATMIQLQGKQLIHSQKAGARTQRATRRVALQPTSTSADRDRD